MGYRPFVPYLYEADLIEQLPNKNNVLDFAGMVCE
jgi:hypothetical protein